MRSASAADELFAKREHDRRGQGAEDEEPDVVGQEGEVVHQKGDLVQEVARHAEDGERDGEGGANFDQAGLAVDFLLADPCFVVFMFVVRGCVDDAIAGALNRRDQIVAARHARQVADAGFFAGEIDRGADDAVAAIQGALDIFLAHSAGHAGDGQVNGRGGDAVTSPFHLGDQVGSSEFVAVVLHIGFFSRQIDVCLGDAVSAFEAALDIFLAHGAGHAGDRQGDFFRRHFSRSLQLLISLRIFCMSLSAPCGIGAEVMRQRVFDVTFEEVIDQAGHALFDGAGAQDALLAAAFVGADHRLEGAKLPLYAADAIDRLTVKGISLGMFVDQDFGSHGLMLQYLYPYRYTVSCHMHTDVKRFFVLLVNSRRESGELRCNCRRRRWRLRGPRCGRPASTRAGGRRRCRGRLARRFRGKP